LVAELQQEIEEKERALYSATVLGQVRSPQHLGRMQAPDARAVLTGWCGDTMEFYLRLEGSTIREAMFVTDGCGPSLACGSMLTTMVQGMDLDEANRITPEDLLSALDGLPEDSQHCATLAVDTLRRAIANRTHKTRGGL
jgi:nitrogen fixation NifU-like protein